MIKCNVKVVGRISKAATSKVSEKDGKSYVHFSVEVSIPVRRGEGHPVEVSVTYPGTDIMLMLAKIGQALEISGTLTFRKRGEMTYLNLFAEDIAMPAQGTDEGIQGTMTFRGKTGKFIRESMGKNNSPVVTFSAFSTEKVHNDKFEYLWVNFIRFGTSREEWLKPKVAIEATGTTDVSLYEGRITIGSRIETLKEQRREVYDV